MAEVKFPAYRQYLEQRQMVNAAVMALLAGSQLASHALQLTEGSDRTMREIFPKVDHIDRFNLKTDTARDLLNHAETHLSAMAIPYIIAVQEALFGTFERMLCDAGKLATRNPKDRRSPVWAVRDYWKSEDQELDGPSWSVFELLVALRHDIIHRAGVVGADLTTRAATLGEAEQSLWKRMSGQPLPVFVEGEKHVLDHADMIVTLAVVKFLAGEGNVIMQSCYPRRNWLTDFADDVRASVNLHGNPHQKLRLARAHARLNYAPLDITDAEIHGELSL
jgi:hypothetical protein